MAHEDHGLALIQVGTENKKLGPAERDRLLRAAWLCSALPIVANVIPRYGIDYWLVSEQTPSKWDRWMP